MNMVPQPDTPVSSERTRPLVEACYAAAFLGALVLCIMLPSQPWSLAIGHPTGDLSDHLQGMWEFGSRVMNGELPLLAQTTHFPTSSPVWFVDPVGGLMAVPLRWMGPIHSYNFVLALQLWLAAVAGWGMARSFGASSRGGLVAGAFIGSSPFLLGLVHSGISEGLGMAPVILFSWALLRAMGRGPDDHGPSWRAGIVASLMLMWVGLQSPVYLAGALVLCIGATLGCFRLIPQRLGILAIIWGLAYLPLRALEDLITHTLGAGDEIAGSIPPGWQPAGIPAIDLVGFVHPGAYYFPDTPSLGNPGILQIHYLGLIAVLLAIAGWRRLKTIRGPVLWMLILCMGPSLCLYKTHIPSLEAPLLLPASMLWMQGSPLDFIHHPYRLVAVLLPLMAVMIAMGSDRLSARMASGAGVLIVLEALFVSPAPWPLTTTDATPPAIYAELPAGPVMDWPPDATDWNRRYVRWQAGHGQQIAYGVNTTFPDAARHDPLLWKTFIQMTQPGDQLKNRDIPGRPPRHTERPRTLAQQGFTTLVLHKGAMPEGDFGRMSRTLTQGLGPPAVRDEQSWAWVLSD